MAAKQCRRVLVGASREALVLARELDVTPDAVVDPLLETERWHDLPVMASDAAAIAAGAAEVILAIDVPAHRRRAGEAYRRAGLSAINLLHGTPGPGTVHGGGLMMQRLANLSVDCKLGFAVRLNIGANVMHDVQLGDYVTVAPNAVLLGRVAVGSDSYIGAGAVVLPGLQIGRNCVVGAGAVVTRNVPDGSTIKGNPAR